MPTWQNGYAGIGKEATYGTAVAPTQYFPLRAGQLSEGHAGGSLVVQGLAGPLAMLGPLATRVSLDVDPQPDPLGAALCALMGAPVTETRTEGWYRHTYTPVPGRPSYSVEVGNDERACRAAGFKASVVNLGISPGQRMRCTIEGTARDLFSRARLSSTSLSTGEAPLWHEATATIDGALSTEVLGFGAVLSAPLMALEGQGADRRICGLLPSGLPTAAGNLTVYGASSAWASYAREGCDLSLTLTAYGSYPGAVSSSMIQVTFPRVRLDAGGLGVGYGQVQAAPVRTALYASAGAPRGFTVTLENITATY